MKADQSATITKCHIYKPAITLELVKGEKRRPIYGKDTTRFWLNSRNQYANRHSGHYDNK